MDVQPVKDFMAQFSKWIRLDAITRMVGFRSWVSPGVIQEILIVSANRLQGDVVINDFLECTSGLAK